MKVLGIAFENRKRQFIINLVNKLLKNLKEKFIIIMIFWYSDLR